MMQRFRSTKVAVFICLILSLSSSASAAKKMPKVNMVGVEIPSQNSRMSLLAKRDMGKYFDWLDQVGTKQKRPTKTDYEKYFSDNIVYRVNDTLLANNINHLYARAIVMRRAVKSMHVIFKPEDVVISGDLGAVRYEIEIEDKKGRKYTDVVNAIFKLSERRIASWNAVVAHRPDS